MLNDIRIKKAMQAVVVFILLSMVLYTGIVVKQLTAQDRQLIRLHKEISVVLDNTHEMRFYLSQMGQFLSDAVATGNSESLNEAHRAADKFKSHLEKAIKADTVPDHLQKLKELGPKFEVFYNLGFEMTNHYMENRRSEGNKLMEKFDAMSIELTKAVADITQIHVQVMGTNLGKAVAASETLRMLAVVIGLIVATFTAGAMLWLTRKINVPLGRSVEVANTLAGGNLTVTIEASSKDETGQLLNAMKEMAEKIKKIIAEVKTTADNVASASEQLSASSEQMSRGVVEQSGRASQIATSSSEMSQTVIDVAKNASTIASSAADTAKVAQEGESVVSRSVEEVKAIAATVSESAQMVSALGERSKQIGEIVSVINDIADQTNLLALNAAIEAARAGEQGRGFAVVADEVRKLAERTTKATKEISGMIKTIQAETGTAVTAMDEGTRKVQNGVRLANEAGDALKEIVTGVENVTDMISHIATSAEEQSATTDEITQNMDSIAEVAKTNVAAIGEVSRATNEMSRLAAELKGLVVNFKIEHASERLPVTRAASGSRKTAEVKQFPLLKKASGQS